MSSAPRRVLFVCTGNICRSPVAEVIATQMASQRQLVFESAGTASWHVGELMDPRAASVLAENGFNPTSHRAQQATTELLAQADIVIALDRKHRQILKGQVNLDETTLALLRPFDPTSGGATDVEDPYYGDAQGFVDCFSVIERSVTGLLEQLESGAL